MADLFQQILSESNPNAGVNIKQGVSNTYASDMVGLIGGAALEGYKQATLYSAASEADKARSEFLGEKTEVDGKTVYREDLLRTQATRDKLEVEASKRKLSPAEEATLNEARKDASRFESAFKLNARPEEVRARAEASLRKLINRAPGLASEIRQTYANFFFDAQGAMVEDAFRRMSTEEEVSPEDKMMQSLGILPSAFGSDAEYAQARAEVVRSQAAAGMLKAKMDVYKNSNEWRAENQRGVAAQYGSVLYTNMFNGTKNLLGKYGVTPTDLGDAVRKMAALRASNPQAAVELSAGIKQLVLTNVADFNMQFADLRAKDGAAADKIVAPYADLFNSMADVVAKGGEDSVEWYTKQLQQQNLIADSNLKRSQTAMPIAQFLAVAKDNLPQNAYKTLATDLGPQVLNQAAAVTGFNLGSLSPTAMQALNLPIAMDGLADVAPDSYKKGTMEEISNLVYNVGSSLNSEVQPLNIPPKTLETFVSNFEGKGERFAANREKLSPEQQKAWDRGVQYIAQTWAGQAKAIINDKNTGFVIKPDEEGGFVSVAKPGATAEQVKQGAKMANHLNRTVSGLSALSMDESPAGKKQIRDRLFGTVETNGESK